MTSRPLPLVAALLLAGVAARAQQQSAPSTAVTASPERSFAIVERSSMRTFQGSWQPSAPLFRYVHDHPGTYVVFAQRDGLYRLDRPEQMAEVERLYAPLKEYSVQQDALAKTQKPLARDQQALAAQQKDTVDPAEKGRIGAAQGAIGQEQGELGALQGELGRQQGEIAKSAYKQMQAIFDRCLADRSCTLI
jgi:hypothetical protein